MLESGIPDRDDWPNGVLDAVAAFRQGDAVKDLPLFWWADPSVAVHEITKRAAEAGLHERVVGPRDRAPYGMVTTQTCDLALEGDGKPKSAWVQLAPVFNAQSTHTSDQIAALNQGRILSEIWLPNIPGPGIWYADLSLEVTVERGWLSQRDRIVAVADEASREKIGNRLAWLRTRPAFDGNFVANIQMPLVDGLRKVKQRKDLFNRMTKQVLEVALRPDSRLEMTSVDIIVLHVGMDDDVREWWEQQLVTAQANGLRCGIAVINAQLVDAKRLSAAEYRNRITMPLNNISPNSAVWGWNDD